MPLLNSGAVRRVLQTVPMSALGAKLGRSSGKFQWLGWVDTSLLGQTLGAAVSWSNAVVSNGLDGEMQRMSGTAKREDALAADRV